MPKGITRTFTAEEFTARIRTEVGKVRSAGKRLDNTATLTERCTEFSAAMLEEVRGSLAAAKTAYQSLSAIEEHLIIRGRTFVEERYAADKELLKANIAKHVRSNPGSAKTNAEQIVLVMKQNDLKDANKKVLQTASNIPESSWRSAISYAVDNNMIARSGERSDTLYNLR